MAKDLSKLLLREGIVSSVRSKYVDKEYQLLDNRIIKKQGWFYEVVIIGGEHLRKFSHKITPIRSNLINAIYTIGANGYSNIDTIPNLGIKLRESRKLFDITTYRLHKDYGLDPINLIIELSLEFNYKKFYQYTKARIIF